MKTARLILPFIFLLSGTLSCGQVTSRDNLATVKVSSSEDILKDLVKQSKYIVRARILSVQSQRERYDEQVEMVMSRIVIQVLDSWKGNLPRKAKIRSFGGVLDGVSYFDSEGVFPRFEAGEEAILFLNDFTGGIFPVGHSAGKMTVIDGVVRQRGKTVNELKSAVLKLK